MYYIGTTTAPFGQQKPAFGAFGGTATSAAPAFGTQQMGAFGTAAPQQPTGGLFGAQKPGAFNFSSTSQPSSGAFTMGGTAGGFTSSGGGLFGATQQKPGGLFGATPGTAGAFGASSGFGSTPAGSFGAAMPGAFGATTAPLGGFGQSTAGLMQQANAVQGHAPIGQSVGSVHDYIASLTANPYGDDPLFKNLVPGSQSESHLEEILKPTNPAAQKALLLAGNQYKISPHRNVKVKPKPILSSIGSSTGPTKSNFSAMSNSPLFDGLEDDDVCSNKNDLFVPRRSVKKLVIRPKSPGHQTNITETRTQACTGIQTANNITNDESLNEGVANAEEDSTGKADDVSLNLPPVIGKDGLHTNGISPSSRNVEGSFLDTRTKKTIGQFNNLASPSPLSDTVPSTTSTPINPTAERCKTGVNKSPPNLSSEAKNKQAPSVRICTSEESVLYNDSDNDSDDPRDQMDDGEEWEEDLGETGGDEYGMPCLFLGTLDIEDPDEYPQGTVDKDEFEVCKTGMVTISLNASMIHEMCKAQDWFSIAGYVMGEMAMENQGPTINKTTADKATDTNEPATTCPWIADWGGIGFLTGGVPFM